MRYCNDSPTAVFENMVLAPQFWWAGGEAALTQNWISGDFETWIDGREHWIAYGVTFLRADIEAIVPKAQESVGQGSQPSTTGEKTQFGVLERKSMLKMVIGMAVKKYRYDPKASKNAAIANIATHLRELKIPLEEDTIRKYLNEAKELLDDYAVD